MTTGGDGIIGFRRGRGLRSALVLAGLAALVIAAPARAQMFSDHPPPVPPAAVPDPGAAVSLAPPSGPASVPSPPPAPLTQPPVSAAVPPIITAPPGAAAPSQGVL